MNVANTKTYTPEQLANAERLFDLLAKLPEDKQCTVTMVANVFMEGMKAQERLAASQASA